MAKKPRTTKAGHVQRIIRSADPREPEKAEIAVTGADHFYRELRMENTLEDEKGKKVKLKEGAHVDLTLEADRSATIPQN